jgi:CheY-like chemotaxis protein
MNILVVDDELDYRLLLGRVLEQRGHRVFLAEHGRDALHKMKIAPMDFIITDVYMPVIDGFNLHFAIRSMEDYREVPVLFVSAYEDDPSHSVIKNPEIDAFHKKERPIEELLAWIDALACVRVKATVRQTRGIRSLQVSATQH